MINEKGVTQYFQHVSIKENNFFSRIFGAVFFTYVDNLSAAVAWKSIIVILITQQCATPVDDKKRLT
jgi:hypothetical protein